MFALLGIESKLAQAAATIALIIAGCIAAISILKVHDMALVYHANQVRDKIWAEKLARVTKAAEAEHEKHQSDIDKAVASVRAEYAQIDTVQVARIAAVERDLAAAKDNPIAFPASMTRKLHADRRAVAQ